MNWPPRIPLRKRQSTDGVLKVTGRDIAENEYALPLRDGRRWELDGTDLDDAAANAQERRDGEDGSENVLALVDQDIRGRSWAGRRAAARPSGVLRWKYDRRAGR